jgi:hypothetical protein
MEPWIGSKIWMGELVVVERLRDLAMDAGIRRGGGGMEATA